MASDGVPLDDKAKRMRDLLSSFYSPAHSKTGSNSSKYATLDTINTNSFSADKYMNLLVQKSSLEGLLQRHVEMAAEIKNLDTDLQMLVYENYNKFISATEAIKRMNGNIVGMEVNMDQLLERIMSVQSRSDGVNTSLFEKREHIEKLHRTRTFLRKVQFIYDLPTRLGKCIKSESYADAVRFYTGAMPIFKAYGATSFQDCKRVSEEAIAIIVKNLQGKLFSDSESIQARAEAAMLLKQLDFPVDTLKAKLLEKLEQSLGDIQLKPEDLGSVLSESNETPRQGMDPVSILATAHEALVREFAEAIRAYRVIFPDSENQLIKIAQDFITKNFETIEHHVKKGISSANLMIFLGFIWKDILIIDDVLHEAVLPDFSLEAAQVAVKECIISSFSQLLQDISDALTRVDSRTKEENENYTLQVALEASKKAVFQGSMDVLLDFRYFLDDGNLGLLLKQRDLIIHWVQEEFHNFFKALDQRFHLLSGTNNTSSQDQNTTEGSTGDKVLPGLVLVLAQLSVFIEQTVIPRITEEIGTSFSTGAGNENVPAFVPGVICQIYHSAGEKLLHHYIKLRIQRISVLLRKRFNTPNWIKHKEPREVHMFVDLFLQELQAIRSEVKQILPHGHLRKHRRSDSSGSANSYLSNTLRDDKMGRSTIQRATSQLLETHLAKLFKQKVDIFTKVEFTQASVVTTITKLCLKSLQEFVRLQTFNRSGFQQIQLDIQFLRTPVKETAEDEEAVDLLLDEVTMAASERCLDPVHLELPILDKLIQAKLSKSKEQSSMP